MEKTTFCRNLKQNSLIISNRDTNLNDLLGYKSQGSLCNIGVADQADLMAASAGYPWPPRSYSCSFCKREFRSAQALGGHMNVHRRDRARLNQITSLSSVKDFNLNADEQFPLLNLNLDPPNPSFFNSSNRSFSQSSAFTSPLSTHHSTKCSHLTSTCGSSVYPKPDFLKMKSGEGLFGIKEVLDKEFCDVDVDKKAEFLKLELEIGLISPSYKEELDLELRLGYTT